MNREEFVFQAFQSFNRDIWIYKVNLSSLLESKVEHLKFLNDGIVQVFQVFKVFSGFSDYWAVVFPAQFIIFSQDNGGLNILELV